MRSPGHAQRRRQRRIEDADWIVAETGLSLETARKWLQFCGFKYHRVKDEWDRLMALTDDNRGLVQAIIGIFFMGKDFCPGKFELLPEGKEMR